MLKTTRSYLHSSGYNTETWRTDRRTNRQTDRTPLVQRSALRAMRTRCKKNKTAYCNTVSHCLVITSPDVVNEGLIRPLAWVVVYFAVVLWHFPFITWSLISQTVRPLPVKSSLYEKLGPRSNTKQLRHFAYPFSNFTGVKVWHLASIFDRRHSLRLETEQHFWNLNICLEHDDWSREASSPTLVR